MHALKGFIAAAVMAASLAACGEVSYVQKASPANEFKDYRHDGSAVLGRGEPISKRQMRANATMRVDGTLSLAEVMEKVANTYNIAVRWGAGVRKNRNERVMIADLTFNEMRAYVEDVYKVQIIREGERRLLVLPSADEPRIREFSPGINVSLAQALRGLADQCDVNLVITENKDKLAESTVTTSLRDVTCLDAFEAILSPYGLSLVDEGDYFTVGGLPQRTWELDLHEPLRSDIQRVAYKSEFTPGQINTDGTGASTSDDEDASGGQAITIIRETRDFWGEMQSNLSALISKSCRQSGDNSGGYGRTQVEPLPAPGDVADTSGTGGLGGSDLTSPEYILDVDPGSYECGYVRVNRSAGLVHMRAPRTILDEADRVIRLAEKIASRRLMIEARVLAVTRAREFQQGANITAAGKGGNTSFGGGTRNSFNSLGSIASSISGRLASNFNTDGGFLYAAGTSIDAVVQLVEQYGTTYQLMKPSIEVMDRQRAILIDGRNERYFIREGETQVTETATIRDVTAEERVQFVGIQFAVTAQIGEPGEPHTVMLQIPMTEITRYDTLTQVFDGETFTDSIPIATTRVIDQKVRVSDNEIKVIGGLTRTMAVDRESGVPLIRGIPVAGKLFNEEDIEYEDVEFVVLLQVKRVN